ncbi:transcription cofactor vestigial-like protein 1 [Pholidichthys leucotaenia]
MEEGRDSPIAVRVEEHSRYVILTYFKGDINTMVNAHFDRALSKICKTKSPVVKSKICKIKLENTSPCKSSAADSCSEPQTSNVAEHVRTINPAEDPPGLWPSFAARRGESSGLQPIMYPLPSEGLSLTGQQYASSLLNLLHGDRGEMGPTATSSKPEFLPNWTVPPGFRESPEPAVTFENGRNLDKDLYWY